MVCTGTDETGFNLFFLRDTGKQVRNPNAYCQPHALNSQSHGRLQNWAADVRTDSLGSLVFLCCFGASWKCHKWFFLTSQSDVSDCKNDGNQWPVSGECKFLPLYSNSPKVGSTFIYDRYSNFPENNLFAPNLELSFQDVYNEESDLTCQFRTLKQNESLHPLRSLTRLLALWGWNEGQKGWAGFDLLLHFALYSPRRASELQKVCPWFGLAERTQWMGSQGQERWREGLKCFSGSVPPFTQCETGGMI